jgi:aspartate/methionine/tyrosine aminotransferase
MARRSTYSNHVCLGKDPRAAPAHEIVGVLKTATGAANVAVSPGICFGEYCDDFVRFSLSEKEARIRQVLRGLKDMFGWT